ncbi:MAG TPA: hypothetical protein VF502_08140 [Stellaceae bacterium]
MSIDPDLPDASGVLQGGMQLLRFPQRSLSVMDAPDAHQIARNLTEKYGPAALAFARDRAARAIEVGDDLALDAWQSVIEATRTLLRRAAQV